MSEKIVTRFAPSPTGNLHSGAYRTAIFAYLYARKNNGKFVLRIEDTDKERSAPDYEQNILESLQWLGLEYDEIYRQSEHVQRHTEVLEKMITDGHAYISKEEAKDGSGAIKEIVRFKNPNSDIAFQDEIKGEVIMNTTDLGDFVIAKNIHEPLFHLAVVVDDFDEGITHVIRGEDHVSNTPRQILIQRAIGAPTPVYAHLPLVLGTDRQKLSKRKGALAITEYRDQGYLPEAILNMIAMIGWHPGHGNEQELFTKEELMNHFDLSQVQKSPAVFNPEKLDWFNREYIKKLDMHDFWTHAHVWLPTDKPWLQESEEVKEILKKIEYLIRDRIVKFSDVTTLFNSGEFDCFFTEPVVDLAMIPWKTDSLETARGYLEQVLEKLQTVSDWDYAGIKTSVWELAEQYGKGNVLWPIRVALSGREKSPDPFELASILGKEKTITRIQKILES